MAATYTPIASITLGDATPSVTFSSIPQTYTDLIIVGQGSAAGDIFVRFNSDSSALYSYTRVFGSGASSLSDRATGQTSYFLTTGGFSNSSFIFQLNNYSNSTTYKTSLTRNTNPTDYVGLVAGLYRSTAAITSILLQSNSSNISSGATFNLYGIQAGNA
jgi:hypothetical protein